MGESAVFLDARHGRDELAGAPGRWTRSGDAVSLHARVGVAVVVVAAVGALLVLVARRRSDIVPTVRVFVRLCGAAAAVQAVIGLVLLAIGERPAEGIHLFYGAATVVPIPLAEVYAKWFPARDETMLLLAGVVATALFGLRAVTTGNS